MIRYIMKLHCIMLHPTHDRSVNLDLRTAREVEMVLWGGGGSEVEMVLWGRVGCEQHVRYTEMVLWGRVGCEVEMVLWGEGRL